jgi:hypothetical protein
MKPFTSKNIFLGLTVLFTLSQGQTTSVPLVLDVYSGIESVLLVWSYPEDIIPVMTTISRTTDLFSSYETIYTSEERFFRYLDRQVEPGQRYFYRITVEDADGVVYSSSEDTPPFTTPLLVEENVAEYPHLEPLKIKPDSTSLDTFEYLLVETTLNAYFTNEDTTLQQEVARSIWDGDQTGPVSWLEWIPIRLLNEYQFIATDTFSLHFQQMIGDRWSWEEPRYRNTFYLTPSEWEAEGDTILLKVERALTRLRGAYDQEWELVNALPPVVIYGQDRTPEEDVALYLAFPHDVLPETAVLFKGSTDSLFYDITLRTDTLSPQTVVLPGDWSVVELWLDGELIQKVPLVNPPARLLVTLDGQYMVGDSTLSLVPRFSLLQDDFSLNEVDYWQDAYRLAVEIAGQTDTPAGYRIVLDNEILGQFYPPYTFQTLFLDSTWTIEPNEAQIRWLHLELQTPAGDWERLESRPIYTESNHYQSRIPDGGPWVEANYTTLGQSNDLSKTTSPQINIPDVFALYQNYPNPFNTSTTITFDLLQPAVVSLYVTDARGRKVNVFLDEISLEKGTYNYIWRGEHYSSGIYFITLQAQVENYLPIIFSRKMVYLK